MAEFIRQGAEIERIVLHQRGFLPYNTKVCATTVAFFEAVLTEPYVRHFHVDLSTSVQSDTM